MDDTGPRAVLERAQHLFLAKDLNGFADMFAVDGTHELPFAPPGVPKFLRGREPIRQYLTSITSTPLELTRFDSLAVYQTEDPETLIAEYEGHGRVVSTGRPYTMPYIQLLRARDGEILTWRDYWSPLAGVQALGVRGLIPTIARTARSHWKRRGQADTAAARS
ncbi:nuclear transport factor 2 family protein [Actinomadura rugatobispora]|uniref:Nuclear transport factor 2 family protein n=1 Tax=Actinomadura rugatobispora TaxID=1994 RepID=A0ABW1A4J7_9ACTN|nr:nuclear transport factor 2 family protein [Actinomadura rugatobispora]